MKKKKPFDVVVLGAGIAGLGVALGLAEKGKKVLVISQKKKGESTPAAAGILDPFLEMSPGHPLFKLSREACLRYPSTVKRLESKTGLKAGFKKTGMLFIAMNSSDLRELKSRLRWQKDSGIPLQWNSKEEILKTFPGVNPALLGGLFYPTIARINSRKLVPVLLKYMKRLNVRFIETKVPFSLIQEKGNVAGVRLGMKEFRADAVVQATGSWAGESSPVKLPVKPAKGQIVMLRGKLKIKTILHSLDGGYIVPWNDKKMADGDSEYLTGSTVEFAGYNSQVTAQSIRKVMNKNKRIFPGLEKLKKTGAWTGLRPFSEKKTPFIGPSKRRGMFLAAGYYRSGILIGLYAGSLLAQAIVTGKVPASLRSFDPRKHSL
jgi:glycine oxidase